VGGTVAETRLLAHSERVEDADTVAADHVFVVFSAFDSCTDAFCVMLEVFIVRILDRSEKDIEVLCDNTDVFDNPKLDLRELEVNFLNLSSIVNDNVKHFGFRLIRGGL
jgi:hypothetical protein